MTQKLVNNVRKRYMFCKRFFVHFLIQCVCVCRCAWRGRVSASRSAHWCCATSVTPTTPTAGRSSYQTAQIKVNIYTNILADFIYIFLCIFPLREKFEDNILLILYFFRLNLHFIWRGRQCPMKKKFCFCFCFFLLLKELKLPQFFLTLIDSIIVISNR